jgi:hypothetical protein
MHELSKPGDGLGNGVKMQIPIGGIDTEQGKEWFWD